VKLPQAPPSQRARLLLVDDLPANLHTLSRHLCDEYELSVATSGAEALTLAEASAPDLILLDVMMPEMDGLETLRRLRQNEWGSDIPVILVTADDRVETHVSGIELGADDFIAKPVVMPVLKVRVRNALGRRQARAYLEQAASVFEHASEAILISDPQGMILDVNAAFTRITGYDRDEAVGRKPSLLRSGRHDAAFYAEMWRALHARGQWSGEIWNRRKDGQAYVELLTINAVRGSGGRVLRYVALFTDISAQKRQQQQLEYLAHHDALTGLPNRFSLQERLRQALPTVRRDNRQLAVMFVDLDRFKIINDTLGHHVGDQLLSRVAQRLRQCVRESDIVARIGGDEFVIVLTGLMVAADAAAVTNKILRHLAEPYRVDGHVLHTTPSIGISIYPADGDSAETLMKAADTAMYHAKEQGRNNAQYFTAAMTREVSERMRLEYELRDALRDGQLELHYQPQVSVGDGAIRAVEALVRWRHPDHGLIPPLVFIPIAEESGQIVELGLWVLEEACRQLAIWRERGMRGMRMAVNISAQQLRAPDLVEAVAQVISRHGLEQGALELELTESVAMADPELAIERLLALRGLGIELTIDDFGTGYSSLAYLKRLPIQALKLDRSFVMDIETDENDAAISAATIALAHSLGLKVVAEGVETEAQSAFLAAHGCDLLQGFRYGRPEPAERLAQAFFPRDKDST